jgi:hypothetical protein
VTVTVNVVDSMGASDSQTYTLTVGTGNTLTGRKFTDLPAGSTAPPPPDAGTTPNAVAPITLAPVTQAVPYPPNAIVYDSALNTLIVSDNLSVNSSGNPAGFLQLQNTGAFSSFAGSASGQRAGFTDEVQMATAQPGQLTQFTPGDIYTSNGQPGQIAKITNNGATVINPWVTLPGETSVLRGNLGIDSTGLWGGNLIAVTTAGDV